MLQIGDEAPDFLARSTDNKGVWLRSLRRRAVVIYFFPKTFTPGCTEETRLFRDKYDEIRAAGAEVIGISVDGFDSQCRFTAQNGVKFPMISDDETHISRSYGIFRPVLRVARRVTYVLDEAGVVEAVFEYELDPARHVKDVVEHLRQRAPADHHTIPPRTRRASGEVIADRYRLKSLLAQGGIGEVWSAEHLHLRQDVAIKLLKESVRASTEQAVDMLERFRLESQVAALLARKTAHVVSVHDAGFSEVGPFLAMELVGDKTLLDELQAHGPMPPERFAQVLEQVGDALVVAHSAGIVHRDLKPSNILIQSDHEGALFVKLADFGLAKSTSDELHLDRPKDTGETIVMGTLEYMSPEQLRGGQRADPRMDVWALGVTAYQMLTGALPFDGPSKTSIMARIVASDVPPISRTKPGLPKALDGWLARALSRDLSRRFGSIREMLDAYRRAISENTHGGMVASIAARQAQENATTEVTPAAMTPVPERRRHPLVAIGAALALAAVCGWAGLQGARKVEEATSISAATPLPVSVGASAIWTGPQVGASELPLSAAASAPSITPTASASSMSAAKPPPYSRASPPPSGQKRPVQRDPSAVF